MPDEQNSSITDPTTTETSAPEQNGDVARQAILRDLTAERSARKALQAQLDELSAAESERAAAAAAERGEFKALYDGLVPEVERLRAENTAYGAREDARIERLTARNTAAIQALPESYRGLVPEGLPPDQIAEQIERIQRIVQSQPGHPRGGQANGGAPGGASAAAKEFAAKYGTTPETAQKIIDQRGARGQV
jgi:hypothetical protein